MTLQGLSFIAGTRGNRTPSPFHAVNPASGESIEPLFFSAAPDEVDAAARAADEAFAVCAHLSGRERGALLRAIADGFDAASADLVARAQLETALPQPRLAGEVARTSGQLRLFAGLIEEGSWVAARIDTALPDRKPLPRPDLRSMLRPIGPVAVFGASNFPLAFSVAGGDTASALAAGNPVIVKAHPAHPGTSELAAGIIASAIHACGLPAGVFSMLFDSGIEIGKALVQHPLVKAVGFTGSHAAGRALMDLAAQRREPIPCFTEMSSTNPVFVLPGALRERAAQIATGLHGSFTLGAGQFCTKPGLVFLPKQNETATFLGELRKLTAGSAAFTLLTPSIAASYRRALDTRLTDSRLQATTATSAAGNCAATAVLLETEINDFLSDPSLSEEVFGPDTLLIHYDDRASMLRAASQLEGHLTATLVGTPEDLAANRDLVEILERKVGRILFNGFPTGVEVCHAMVHGGPYPATSDGRFTSVGSLAILRFARPVCYQGFPHASLPQELHNENPSGILRMVNGELGRDAIPSAG
jgi:alpha-ketoglutaric semialdehyde dehydrogenase